MSRTGSHCEAQPDTGAVLTSPSQGPFLTPHHNCKQLPQSPRDYLFFCDIWLPPQATMDKPAGIRRKAAASQSHPPIKARAGRTPHAESRHLLPVMMLSGWRPPSLVSGAFFIQLLLNCFCLRHRDFSMRSSAEERGQPCRFLDGHGGSESYI